MLSPGLLLLPLPFVPPSCCFARTYLVILGGYTAAIIRDFDQIHTPVFELHLHL